MSEDLENVNSREDLLDESIKLLEEKRVVSKALKDIAKNVLKETSGDKNDWKVVSKFYYNKGKGWANGGDPLTLEKEAPKKDTFSQLCIRLRDTIRSLVAFGKADLLDEYLQALDAAGIGITLKGDLAPQETGFEEVVDEALDSAKSYYATIESYNDELKNVHAPKSEELNFTVAGDYSSALKIYRKKIKGKAVDDDVQNINLRCEMLETALNLINDMEVDEDVDAKA